MRMIDDVLFLHVFAFCHSLLLFIPLYFRPYYLKSWSGDSSPCSGLEGPSPRWAEGPSTALRKDTW